MMQRSLSQSVFLLEIKNSDSGELFSRKIVKNCENAFAEAITFRKKNLGVTTYAGCFQQPVLPIQPKIPDLRG